MGKGSPLDPHTDVLIRPSDDTFHVASIPQALAPTPVNAFFTKEKLIPSVVPDVVRTSPGLILASNLLHFPLDPRRDVLKAVSTINKYIDELNDPIARKLEGILGSFNRQLRLDETRSMKATTLTDFFQRL
ncbi:hypothetical protein BC826DRAFT_1106910 [Russula brevipes]|nr:hypothetical protein BC826DRAFT_1106910 [Russula brevipes]